MESKHLFWIRIRMKVFIQMIIIVYSKVKKIVSIGSFCLRQTVTTRKLISSFSIVRRKTALWKFISNLFHWTLVRRFSISCVKIIIIIPEMIQMDKLWGLIYPINLGNQHQKYISTACSSFTERLFVEFWDELRARNVQLRRFQSQKDFNLKRCTDITISWRR